MATPNLPPKSFDSLIVNYQNYLAPSWKANTINKRRVSYVLQILKNICNIISAKTHQIWHRCFHHEWLTNSTFRTLANKEIREIRLTLKQPAELDTIKQRIQVVKQVSAALKKLGIENEAAFLDSQVISLEVASRAEEGFAELGIKNYKEVLEALEGFCKEVDLLTAAHLEPPPTYFSTLKRLLASHLPPEKIASLTHKAASILNTLPEGWNTHPIEPLQRFSASMNVLFYKIFPLLDASPFNSTAKFPREVQEFLEPNLKKLRMEKAGRPHDQEHRLQRKILKGQLAEKMGFGKAKTKGATGTLLIKDINGKPIGVYKVSRFHERYLLRIENFFKSFFGQLNYLSNSFFAQPLAEKAAYVVSRQLDFGLAPPSDKASFFKKEGVFQIFVSKEKNLPPLAQVKEALKSLEAPHEARVYEEAVNAIEKFDSKAQFSEQELFLFQKFAIFDYFIGNLDRHEENWLVILSKENELMHIKAIDNANSFPHKHPSKGAYAARNRYKWKQLNIAKHPFTEETRKFIRSHFAPLNIADLIREIDRQIPGFLNNKMKKLLLKRAQVIMSFADSVDAGAQSLGNCADDASIKQQLRIIKR